MPWVENKEKTPLDNAKELVAHIKQTIENPMMSRIDQDRPRDHKQDLKEINSDLAKLLKLLDRIK